MFALHDIARDAKLEFAPDPSVEPMRLMPAEDIPAELLGYCIAREGDLYLAPQAFNHMWIGWYLNHSATPNAEEREEECYYAARDIPAGEEITADYNKFNEPDDKKDAFYRQG